MTGEWELERLEGRLGHRFADRRLLARALTHRSAANELVGTRTAFPSGTGNYERLEFLGDAVLDLVAARWLFRRLGGAAEGDLTRIKSHLVSEPVLAREARRLGLGEAMRLGVGEERSGGREKPSLLADVLEAVLGALFVDAGLDAAAPLAEPMLEEALERFREAESPPDAKTDLQERLQARGRELPEYVVAAESGPDHDKRFTVECVVEGAVAGVGEGRSKKRAEQAAAAAVLRSLDDPHDSGPNAR